MTSAWNTAPPANVVIEFSQPRASEPRPVRKRILVRPNRAEIFNSTHAPRDREIPRHVTLRVAGVRRTREPRCMETKQEFSERTAYQDGPATA